MKIKILLSVITSMVITTNSFGDGTAFNLSALPKKMIDMVQQNVQDSTSQWAESTARNGMNSAAESLRSCAANAGLGGLMSNLGGLSVELPCGETWSIDNPADDIINSVSNDISNSVNGWIDDTIENIADIFNYADLYCRKDVQFVPNLGDYLVSNESYMAKMVRNRMRDLREKGICGDKSNVSNESNAKYRFNSNDSYTPNESYNADSTNNYNGNSITNRTTDTILSDKKNGTTENSKMKSSSDVVSESNVRSSIVAGSKRSEKGKLNIENMENQQDLNELIYNLKKEEETLLNLKIEDSKSKETNKTLLLDNIEDYNIVMNGVNSTDEEIYTEMAKTNYEMKNNLVELQNTKDERIKNFIEDNKMPIFAFTIVEGETENKTEGVWVEGWRKKKPSFISGTISPFELFKNIPTIKSGEVKNINNSSNVSNSVVEKLLNKGKTNGTPVTEDTITSLYEKSGILDVNGNFTGKFTYDNSMRLLMNSTDLVLSQIKSPESENGQFQVRQTLHTANLESNRVISHLLDKIIKLKLEKNTLSQNQYKNAVLESVVKRNNENQKVLNDLLIQITEMKENKMKF